MNVLDSDYEKRAKPEKDVWHWQDYSSWVSVVRELFADILDDQVVGELRDSGRGPEDIHTDDLSWLDEIIESVHGLTMDSAEVLASRLSNYFVAVRAFHATRAHSQSFYDSGIVLPDPRVDASELIRIFGRAGIPESEVLWALEERKSEGPEDRVFFEAKESVLVGTASHYAIYGSEHLLSIASYLEFAGRLALRHPARGRPTIFVCDVPIEMMNEGTIHGMAREALTMACWEILGDEEPVSGYYGFCLREALPPEYVVGHYFPESLEDPIEGFVVRHFDATGAEM